MGSRKKPSNKKLKPAASRETRASSKGPRKRNDSVVEESSTRAKVTSPLKKRKCHFEALDAMYMEAGSPGKKTVPTGNKASPSPKKKKPGLSSQGGIAGPSSEGHSAPLQRAEGKTSDTEVVQSIITDKAQDNDNEVDESSSTPKKSSTNSKRSEVTESPIVSKEERMTGAFEVDEKWTIEQEHRMIDAWQEAEFLYDKKHRDHKNRVKKEFTMRYIGRIVMKTGLMVASKINCFRTAYTRSLNPKSGSKKPHPKTVDLMERLSFLKGHVTTRGGTSSMDDDDEGKEDTAEEERKEDSDNDLVDISTSIDDGESGDDDDISPPTKEEMKMLHTEVDEEEANTSTSEGKKSATPKKSTSFQEANTSTSEGKKLATPKKSTTTWKGKGVGKGLSRPGKQAQITAKKKKPEVDQDTEVMSNIACGLKSFSSMMQGGGAQQDSGSFNVRWGQMLGEKIDAMELGDQLKFRNSIDSMYTTVTSGELSAAELYYNCKQIGMQQAPRHMVPQKQYQAIPPSTFSQQPPSSSYNQHNIQQSEQMQQYQHHSFQPNFQMNTAQNNQQSNIQRGGFLQDLNNF